VPYTNHSTAQLIENWNNSQVSYRIQISNLPTQHIVTSQSYLCVAKRNSTVMVIITLKAILNEKIVVSFFPGDPTILAIQQKVVPHVKYKILN